MPFASVASNSLMPNGAPIVTAIISDGAASSHAILARRAPSPNTRTCPNAMHHPFVRSSELARLLLEAGRAKHFEPHFSSKPFGNKYKKCRGAAAFGDRSHSRQNAAPQPAVPLGSELPGKSKAARGCEHTGRRIVYAARCKCATQSVPGSVAASLLSG